jgi:signal transduction histidine kinase
MRRLSRVRSTIDDHPLAIDALVAAVLCALALLTLRIHWPDVALPPTGTTLGLAALVFLPLALRRRFPLAVLAAMTPALVAYRLADIPESTWSINAWWVALYSAGAYGRAGWRDWTRVAGIIAITGLILYELVGTDATEMAGNRLALGLVTLLSNAVIFAAVWWLGDSVRVRREQQAELEQRARELERERVENARRAVLEERVRIAREMHDVVAHHVSVMGIQAGAARRVLHRQPDRAEQALSLIESASRQAVNEMYGLLGLLREATDPTAPVPQPGLRDLNRLIAEMRDAGLAVEIRIQGTAAPLPPALDLSAYRIIQEALTNTLKHAGGATARVTVRYGNDGIEIEVVDDGHGPGTVSNGTGGNGLIGMRERVGLLGGSLDAGYHPGVGFSVRASLPLNGRST